MNQKKCGMEFDSEIRQLRKDMRLNFFLMSAGVEIESIIHKKYNAKKQIDEFTENGGIFLLVERALNFEGKMKLMCVQFQL